MPLYSLCSLLHVQCVHIPTQHGMDHYYYRYHVCEKRSLRGGGAPSLSKNAGVSEYSELVVSQLLVFHLPLPRCYMFTVGSFFTHPGQKGLMFPNDQPIETGRLMNEYIIVNVNTA